jgi:transposase
MASAKKGAQKRGAKLVFLDESGFSLKPSVRRTWAPRGHTPLLSHPFSWKRLNAIGSLVCQPDGSDCDLLLCLQPRTIKEDAIMAYLQALRQQVPGPLVLLWDRLPAHCSGKVDAFVKANTSWLTVEWLPAYAPELNPVEYFWSALKGKPLANLAPDTLAELEQAIQRNHRKMRKRPDDLHEFLVASSLFAEDMPVKTSGESQ